MTKVEWLIEKIIKDSYQRGEWEKFLSDESMAVIVLAEQMSAGDDSLHETISYMEEFSDDEDDFFLPDGNLYSVQDAKELYEKAKAVLSALDSRYRQLHLAMYGSEE